MVAGGGGITALAGVLFFPWLNAATATRSPLIGICAGAGFVILLGSCSPGTRCGASALIFVANFFAFGTLPLFWSVAMSRMSGLMAAAGLAFINMLGITGGFVGPFVYGLIEDATDSLVAPYYVIAAAACVAVALVPVLARAVRNDAAATAAAARPDQVVS